MSKKALDSHERWRNVTVAFRMSPEESQALNDLVKLSGLTKQDYITKRLLNKDIVVVGTPRVYKALKTQIAQICAELQRLSSTAEASPEFWETLRVVAKIYEGMEKGGRNDEAF